MVAIYCLISSHSLNLIFFSVSGNIYLHGARTADGNSSKIINSMDSYKDNIDYVHSGTVLMPGLTFMEMVFILFTIITESDLATVMKKKLMRSEPSK